MKTYLTRVEANDVVDAVSFMAYCQQCVGTPVGGADSTVKFYKQAKVFFARNPQATYQTLVRTLHWCKGKRIRLAHAHSVFTCVNKAWKDRALPELDPVEFVDPHIEARISEVLEFETDTAWRSALLGSRGPARLEALRAYDRRPKVAV